MEIPDACAATGEEVAQVELDAINPVSGDPIHVYLFFVVNKAYLETKLEDFLSQNQETLMNAAGIREKQRFSNRAAADAHVKINSIDAWNKVDMYWWPPLILGEPAQ